MMRVLIVGYGLIGKTRAKAALALAKKLEVELAGTVDPTPRPGDELGDVPHFASLEAAPRSSYDAAVVAVPHHLAKPIALELFAQGKPVLLEKPLGLDRTEAAVIANAAEAVALPSFVGYNYRFLPHFDEVFSRLASGWFGKLRSIDMLLGHGGHPNSAKEWKLDPKLAGGGVLIDPGVHLLDLALVLGPDLAPHAAAGSKGFWGTGIEEDVSVVLRAPSLVATLRVSHIRWVNTFRVEVVGEDGYALLEGRGGTYGPLTARFGKRWAWNDGTRRTQRETEDVLDFGPANPSFERELERVLRAWTGAPLTTSPQHPATMGEALRVAELCDALYRQMAF